MRNVPLPPRGLATALLLLIAGALSAQQLIAVPPLTGRVVDLTGTLSAADQAGLEGRLSDLEARKGSQIAVLLVPTVRPETIEQYAIRVVDSWKLGRKDEDDGILLLVAKDDREVRIEVGYGLEGAIPDATANRVIDENLLPRFRDGDYAGGISAGLDRLIALVDGEPLPAPQRQRPRNGGESPQDLYLLVLILSLVVGGILRRLLGQFPGAIGTGTIATIVAWLVVGTLGVALLIGLFSFIVALAAGSSGGRWASHRRGGYGGGLGRGGGGFGGGGGGFGGGGASGRW